MIKKILFHGSRIFYARDLSKDFHTQFGFIKSADLKKTGSAVSNTGKEFFVVNPSFIDSYRKIRRAPQVIPLKDIGSIITETGINKKSRVVDAGAGSGALSLFIANLAKEVVTYEIREDFARIAEENIKMLGLKNIKLKRKNVYEGIDEKEVDLITLDVPEPWKALNSASKSLRTGGFLVSYSPTIPQVNDYVSELKKKNNFICIKTIEIIEREWEFEERKIRPKSQAIGHSGFLTFARKMWDG